MICMVKEKMHKVEKGAIAFSLGLWAHSSVDKIIHNLVLYPAQEGRKKEGGGNH